MWCIGRAQSFADWSSKEDCILLEPSRTHLGDFIIYARQNRLSNLTTSLKP